LKSKVSATINLKNPINPRAEQDAKLELRKLRFSTGLSDQVTTQSAQEIAESEKKKLHDRAKKFGLVTVEDEDAKKKKRAERFKMTPQLTETEEKQKMMERALRFGTMTAEMEDERKELRIQRFGKIANEEEGDNIRKKFKKF